MRYKVEGEWHARAEQPYAPYVVQWADARDTVTGTVFEAGAQRVIDERTGKPVTRGKGGAVPFFGETAWSDAQRLQSDMFMADLYHNVVRS